MKDRVKGNVGHVSKDFTRCKRKIEAEVKKNAQTGLARQVILMADGQTGAARHPTI
jgi:hypothetical protein